MAQQHTCSQFLHATIMQPRKEHGKRETLPEACFVKAGCSWESGRLKVRCPNGSGDSDREESRHSPGRLKVAPYEVRGRVAQNGHSPERDG